MPESDQFDALAARFRTEADEAPLANVRDRCLRAAAAWEARANTSRRTEASRARRAAGVTDDPIGDPTLVAALPLSQ